MNDVIFALDFDGVICDSAIETGISGWQVAKKIWPEMSDEMPANILASFRYVRPAMETGYESIIINRALYEGVSAKQLLNSLNVYLKQITHRDQLEIAELKNQFGQFRDNWMKTDLSHWVGMNPLYAGIKQRLKTIHSEQLIIITTKQSRFVSAILEANELHIPETQIYGLECQRSKPDILNDLLEMFPQRKILFVEDRLPTLINVKESVRLQSIKLFLADWGYNTEADKRYVQQDDTIHSLTLSTFSTLN